MRHGYIPTPYSIHTGLRKLVPGAMLTVSRRSAGEASLERYWSPREAATRGTLAPFVGSPDEAVSELDALLRSAVKLRMQADVPLGAFLSGGIDSSTIVALMQAQSAAPGQDVHDRLSPRTRLQRGGAREGASRGTSGPITPSCT